MSAILSQHPAVKRLCDALGVDWLNCIHITIDIPAGDIATAKVTMLLNEEAMDILTENALALEVEIKRIGVEDV